MTVSSTAKVIAKHKPLLLEGGKATRPQVIR